jgi:DNA primase
MRFSDAFLRQVRDRASIADYAGRRLTWDARKSRPSAGDYWACCPFHQEKSASFHVLDAKGIFNCFGCGEKGDVFKLAQKLEGLSFPEAVERLAESVGMALPAEDEEDRAAADARRGLYGVLDKAARYFAEALFSAEGRAARDYLTGRGLGEAEWARFGIGYAPGGWDGLITRAGKAGVGLDALIAAGLARPGDAGRNAIDTFRDRITFEIADSGGKVIAFGARALDPKAAAKYINSPETALFHKGRTLYRLKQARETIAKTKAQGPVIAEGYLDVIALERAGIAAAAPLGTALTEDQLALAWRAGPAPLLCFDGDDAGRRAAARALALALPHFGPGKTVRIAVLPAGQDPDDLYRNGGAPALTAALSAAQPAFEALFEREQSAAPLSTPEAKADFKQRLRKLAGTIQDEETRRHYLRELLSRADAVLRPPQRPFQGRGKGRFAPQPQPHASRELRASAQGRLGVEDLLRAAVDHPPLMAKFGEWIDRLRLPNPELAAIRGAIQALTHAEAEPGLVDRAALTHHFGTIGEERAAARVSRWPAPRTRPEDNPGGDEAEAQWLARMALEVILPAILEEMAEARSRADGGDAEAFARFQALGREARALKAQATAGADEPEAA